MGTFRVNIEIGDPAGQHYETVEALVDTRATYTTVSAPFLERLGVVPHVRDTFVLADGRRVERDIGRTWVRVDGRLELTLVVFGDANTPSVLGAYTLEGLRLAADPVGRRLIPVPGLLLRSMYDAGLDTLEVARICGGVKKGRKREATRQWLISRSSWGRLPGPESNSFWSVRPQRQLMDLLA